MGHIIIGFIMMIAGFFIILKSEWFLRNFGRISFFERHMAIHGGSRLGYKLIGMIIFLIGILLVVNLFGVLAKTILSPLISY